MIGFDQLESRGNHCGRWVTRHDWPRMGGTVAQISHSTCSRPRRNPSTKRHRRKSSTVAKNFASTAIVGLSGTTITGTGHSCRHGAESRTKYCHRNSPAPDMAGRSNLLDEHAVTSWNHDHQSIGPTARQQNSARHILNASNAIITEDATRTIVACFNRDLPDRSREFPPIGPSVQIAVRNQWPGFYRVVGRSPSNIAVGNGKKGIQMAETQGAIDCDATRRRS